MKYLVLENVNKFGVFALFCYIIFVCSVLLFILYDLAGHFSQITVDIIALNNMQHFIFDG